jgi:RNA polymerase sigma factor (sigma-70 family)
LYEREFTPPLSEDDPEKALERKEEVERIMAALAQLPEEERIVFELAAIEGFSSEEVGRILNMPASEIERIKAKARQKVLRELQSPAVKKAS